MARIERGLSRATSQFAMREVSVYLIRHGESASNVEFKIFLESLMGFLCLNKCSLQNLSRFLLALWKLTLGYEADTQLSELGKQQVSSKLILLIDDLQYTRLIGFRSSCLFGI
jgi:hypothetical protein